MTAKSKKRFSDNELLIKLNIYQSKCDWRSMNVISIVYIKCGVARHMDQILLLLFNSVLSKTIKRSQPYHTAIQSSVSNTMNELLSVSVKSLYCCFVPCLHPCSLSVYSNTQPCTHDHHSEKYLNNIWLRQMPSMYQKHHRRINRIIWTRCHFNRASFTHICDIHERQWCIKQYIYLMYFWKVTFTNKITRLFF